MAKRKVSLRRSKRFSGNRSSSLYNSTVLDSNSTILGEESRFWWNDLEENTSLRYSLIRNNGNETTQQLSQNSETKSDQNTLQWYKYLSSDSEHNASNSKENFNRVAVKTHRKVIASTTSESENEVDVTKAKRFNLRPARKTTEKNVFLDVLNTDTGTNSDSGSLNNKNSQIKLHESIEDSPNLSIRLKPNIFKKKRGNKVEDRNIFQDVLAKNSILDSSIRKKSFGLDKEFLQNSTSQNIDTNKDYINDQRKGSIKLSQALSLDNEIDSLDVSTLKNQNATFENNIMSDIDETEHGNDKSKRLGKRMKSYFSRRARRSTGRNAFEIALADDQDISALNASKKQLLNISKEKNKDNIEEDTSSSSLNNNEIRKSVKFSKSKIKYSRSHNKSLNENSQKEPFEQNNTNGEQTLSILTERLSNLSPGKETRLTRNSSKTRFETPTPTKKRARKVTNDDLEHNINEEQNSDTLVKRLPNSSSGKETRLTRNTSRIRSETPTPTKKGAREITNDDLEHNINEEQNSDTLVKRLPNSSSGKETRLTRNSSKTRFETPTPTKKRAREITNDDLEHNINEEQNSDTLVERLPNSSSGKETRLTRNTSRIRSETPTPTKKGAREITNDNSEYDMNKEQDSSTLDKESPNSSPGKKTRLTRNTSRIRSETPTPTKKGAREITNDNSEYDMNKEQDSSTLDKEPPNSSPGKKTRLTRNTSRIRSETPTPTKKGAREITNDNSEYDMNKEQDSSTLDKESPNSSPGKKTRLTRNTSRIRSETPTPTKKGAREITNDNSEYDMNKEQDSSTLDKESPNSSPGKKTRLTRNTSRIRSETPTPTKKGAREITNDNSEYDMNKEQDSSTLDKESPNSSPGKKTRLTRNTSRIRSETPTPTKKGAREITNDNSEYDMNKEQDSSTLDKELSKSSSGKEARLTHNSSQSRYKTPNFTSGAKLSTQSANKNVHIEDVDVDSVSTISEINVDDSLPITSSTRISSAQINEGVKAHKNATLFFNTADEEDVFATQMVQRKYSSPGNRTSNKTINQQTLSTVVNLNSIKENKETAHRQKSLNRSSQNGSTPIKALMAEPSTSNNKNLAPLQTFNEKMEKIKMELETRNQTKSHEVAATDKKKYELKVRNANPVSIVVKQRAKNKVPAKSTKKVDKAFLVNGEVYRVPRLPRPKYWVTDHLYKFLWNRMEEKYKFATRIKSEKFVQELSKIVSFICNSKKYDSYKMELKALMKEMARLNIIKTRNDFYNFCWDFMPYEFRVKAVPMLLPDNKRTIPYDPEMLHTPLLSDDHYDD
ncbi:uncharacterized protein DDB_G0288805-like isoform X2 [Linepithema humile]|uniref:uncharacterized protein DDB_G0288805-like isoform X2 n=1 Tax=Linepithema humile TaxID=83485 RepID=UPI00351E6926